MTFTQNDTQDSLHLCVSENTEGRDFIAPDIHGHYDAFMTALDRVAFDPEVDRVFAVGDIIDRGPNNLACLSLLRQPWFATVLGNHEQMLVQSLLLQSQSAWSVWLSNGGSWSVDVDPNTLLEFARVLRQLPYTLTLVVNNKTIGLCHAQYRLNSWEQRFHANEEHQQDWLWGRTRVKLRDSTPVDDIDWVFSGHTIVNQTTKLGNSVFIETGAYLGNPINLIDIQQWGQEN